jgi:integrase
MQAAWGRLERNASGDYSPDTHARRFPEWRDDAPEARPTTAPAVTLTGLVAGWRVEAVARNLSPSTIEGYERTFAQLRAFLGHDDAGRVTPDDVIGFKDHRLASLNPRTGKPLTAKTVNHADLVALKAVFGWGVTNLKVPTNPAAGISIKKARVQRGRSKGFTDVEANALLAAAWRHRNPLETPKTEAAKRWVPWLCAYTGARVGEMVQLRREDVRQEEGAWAINITPDAVTTKDGQSRLVVLHSYLLEMGFVAFALAAEDGPLFLTVGKARDGSPNLRGAWKGLKNRLQKFARETVTDTRVAPNHGWRHRFKTVGRRINMPRDVLHGIQAHRTGDVADDYGDIEIDVQAREIEKMPRYPEG